MHLNSLRGGFYCALILFLGSTNHTKEKSQEQNLHLVSRGLSSVKAEGVPVVGEDEKCATFYSILMLV